MRFPLIRIGLLLVVGSVFASLMMFWTSMGVAAADINNDTEMSRALESKVALWDHFRDHFLFSGSIPGILFWLGCAMIFIGGWRLAMRPPVSAKAASSVTAPVNTGRAPWERP